MLVLTRKKGEAIFIGKDIKVIVLETEGDKVKIGIEAPKDIALMRAELLEDTKAINLQSAHQTKDIGTKLSGLKKKKESNE